jgi:hypothetical protein
MGTIGFVLRLTLALAASCKGSVEREVDRVAGEADAGGVVDAADGPVPVTDAASDPGAEQRDGPAVDARSDGPVLCNYGKPKYAGDAACAPEQIGKEFVSCCDGEPCHGECVLSDGGWECNCCGLVAGCGPLGMVCCGIGCKEPGTCGWLPK